MEHFASSLFKKQCLNWIRIEFAAGSDTITPTSNPRNPDVKRASDFARARSLGGSA
jgi:hypothetical protein